MASAEGREAVDYLLQQIDERLENHTEEQIRQMDIRFEAVTEMIDTAHLGAAMNHAMQMSSCIFCEERLVPRFHELPPEVGFLTPCQSRIYRYTENNKCCRGNGDTCWPTSVPISPRAVFRS